MSQIKIGIIGVGGISEVHIAGYLKNPDVELYAFCDINEKRLKLMGEKYGITRLFTDKDEMLKLAEIDAVSVCTWNSAHAPCTIAALNAGKHVLCEKPMATSAKQAVEMQQAAERNHKLLMIGFVRRYDYDCAMLQDFIKQDFFGEIYYAKATYLRRNGNPGGWFGDKSRSAGGPLIDLGVHVIDLVRYVMGNPKPVSIYGATFTKLLNRPNVKGAKAYSSTTEGEVICDVEDLATALVRFDNGAVLSVETSYSLNLKKDEGKVELYGTKGGVKMDPELEMYTETNGYLADITPIPPNTNGLDNMFTLEMKHFADCIINDTPCISPAQDGVEIMRILDAIYESARTGHEVLL